MGIRHSGKSFISDPFTRNALGWQHSLGWRSALWARCQPHRHGTLSLAPQHPHKSQSSWPVCPGSCERPYLRTQLRVLENTVSSWACSCTTRPTEKETHTSKYKSVVLRLHPGIMFLSHFQLPFGVDPLPHHRLLPCSEMLGGGHSGSCWSLQTMEPEESYVTLLPCHPVSSQARVCLEEASGARPGLSGASGSCCIAVVMLNLPCALQSLRVCVY